MAPELALVLVLFKPSCKTDARCVSDQNCVLPTWQKKFFTSWRRAGVDDGFFASVFIFLGETALVVSIGHIDGEYEFNRRRQI
jgi:hypothetical protein